MGSQSEKTHMSSHASPKNGHKFITSVQVSCEYGCTIDGSKETWTPMDFSKFGNSSNYTDTTPQHYRNTTVWNWCLDASVTDVAQWRLEDV